MKDALLERAQRLRQAFDEGFSRPSALAQQGAVADLLAITVSGTRYALRLDEVTGMAADRKLVPVPSPVPGFLGVVALRGEVTPVYSLATLLGHGGAAPTRWLAICSDGPLHLALAFDTLEGHLRAPRDALKEVGAHAEQAHGHVRSVIHIGGAACAVVSVPSVFATIRKQCGIDHTS